MLFLSKVALTATENTAHLLKKSLLSTPLLLKPEQLFRANLLNPNSIGDSLQTILRNGCRWVNPNFPSQRFRQSKLGFKQGHRIGRTLPRWTVPLLHPQKCLRVLKTILTHSRRLTVPSHAILPLHISITLVRRLRHSTLINAHSRNSSIVSPGGVMLLNPNPLIQKKQFSTLTSETTNGRSEPIDGHRLKRNTRIRLSSTPQRKQHSARN